MEYTQCYCGQLDAEIIFKKKTMKVIFIGVDGLGVYYFNLPLEEAKKRYLKRLSKDEFERCKDWDFTFSNGSRICSAIKEFEIVDELDTQWRFK